MRAKCPKCGEKVDAADFTAGDRTECPQCGTRLKLPADSVEAIVRQESSPFDFDDVPRPAPPPPAQPMIVPVPYLAEHPEYTQEKIEDLRERRDDRRERRQHDREDRVSNGVGIAGFALCTTSALLVLSGAIFARDLKAYAWFASILALALTLGGLPCAIIGSLRPGRSRVFALIGAGLGGLLLLLFLPALMLSLTSSSN